MTVSFDVSDNVGVARVDVKFIRYSGTETVHLEWTKATAPTSYSFSHRFDFSIAEALVAGADVNITAFDVNENGAWGDFHVKSILQAIADAIAAFLSAIAKVVAEALSALFSFIIQALRIAILSLLDFMVHTLLEGGERLIESIGAALKSSRGPELGAALVAALLFAWVSARRLAVLLFFAMWEGIEIGVSAILICATGGSWAVLKAAFQGEMKNAAKSNLRGISKSVVVSGGLGTLLSVEMSYTSLSSPNFFNNAYGQAFAGVLSGWLIFASIVDFIRTILEEEKKVEKKIIAATLAFIAIGLSMLGLAANLQGEWALWVDLTAFFIAIGALALELVFSPAAKFFEEMKGSLEIAVPLVEDAITVLGPVETGLALGAGIVSGKYN